MRILFHFLYAALILGSFFNAEAGHFMTVYDPVELSLFISRFRTKMIASGIVDTDGSYYEPFFNVDKHEVKESFLFEGLSPSFRCPDARKADSPKTFKEYAVPGAAVRVEKNSFKLTQGLETVECCALAYADWGGDGTKDAIVLCRVKRARALGFLSSDKRGLQASEKPAAIFESQRDYYLVIPRGSKIASVVGICDYSSSGRQALFDTFAEAEHFGLFKESLTVEMIRGQGTVIEVPETVFRERQSFGKKTLSD